MKQKWFKQGCRGCFVALLPAWLLLSPRPEGVWADEWYGDWSLRLESKTPAWMSIREMNGKPAVKLRLHVGPDGPHKVTEYTDKTLKLTLRSNKRSQVARTLEATFEGGRLVGQIHSVTESGKREVDRFVGKKIPPGPKTPPDLTKVRYGAPISLFNGKDLSGWRPHEKDKINGWSVEDGVLVNNTPKIDFSATGAYANLRTEAVFEDFRLHIEFLVEKDRNSGVYLRGMYEAQVVDRDSRMQGIQGAGAIFGQIEPSKNAGFSGGKWQTYDLTLVDRHITVVLNGEKVIDNAPLSGPTGGAVFTDPTEPGPIHLQGDHTQVKFRNIYLAPVLDPASTHSVELESTRRGKQ